jgi:hypothetical protein
MSSPVSPSLTRKRRRKQEASPPPTPPTPRQYRQNILDSYWHLKTSAHISPLTPADGIVLALYDESALAIDPWLDRGFECHVIAPAFIDEVTTCNLQNLKLLERKMDTPDDLALLFNEYKDVKIAFACAFPPSDELSIAGARWFKSKEEKNPEFQNDQIKRFPIIEKFFTSRKLPFYIQAPHSPILTRLFRRPNLTYQPCHFGGYLSPKEEHERFPGVIPVQDAFTSKMSVFAGGRFRHPCSKPIEPLFRSFFSKKTGKVRRLSVVLYSRRHKSARRCPPRGWTRAACAALT